MAMLKSRKKTEFERQVSIAQTALDWMKQMHIDTAGTRAAEIIEKHLTVEHWVEKYMPERQAGVKNVTGEADGHGN